MDAEAKKFLQNLWADNAPINRQTPESAGIDRTSGWDINYEQRGTGKYPERKVWNQMIRELQGAFREKMVYGFPRWAADVDWKRYDFITYGGGIYFATVDNGPSAAQQAETPGTGTVWRKY